METFFCTNRRRIVLLGRCFLDSEIWLKNKGIYRSYYTAVSNSITVRYYAVVLMTPKTEFCKDFLDIYYNILYNLS